MAQHLCQICGLIYDEALGDPERGIPPGTRWEDLPADWHCPDCGSGRNDFEPNPSTQEGKPMSEVIDLVRQHLIDPETCARCDSCEFVCTKGAIRHDHKNYVVDADICDACGECVQVCPTGAVDHWHPVEPEQRYSMDQQFGWDVLPPVAHAEGQAPVSDHSVPHTPVAFDRRTPAQAVLRLNRRVTAEDADTDVRHLVFDLGEQAFPVQEGQAVGILPPGVDALGAEHNMRLYSVSGIQESTGVDGNTLALTVKRVRDVKDGVVVNQGVCSNHLCDSLPGDTVLMAGPFGDHFRPPDDPCAALMMICTGTGIAPMRGMIERRLRRAKGKSMAQTWLYYGGRSRSEMAYLDEVPQWQQAGVEVRLALSREPGESKAYVQDLLLQDQQVLADALRDECTHFFVCGLRNMEEGMKHALETISASMGEEGKAIMSRLRRSGRLHIETY